MDKYEVTKELWDSVYVWAITNEYGFEHTGLGKAANHPVTEVSWYDIVKWCNARSQKEGLSSAYYTDTTLTAVYKTGRIDPFVNWNMGYRLPTEAEWEYAARGGLSGKRFPWGDIVTHNQANYYSTNSYSYDASSTRGYHPNYNDFFVPCSSPAGSFAANGYELYDMLGNMMEWCWDWAGASYSSGIQTNPRGPTSGTYRLLRGGSWRSSAWSGRVAYRFQNNYPSSTGGIYCTVGFRTVLPSSQ